MRTDNAVAALSGHGEDLGLQTHVPMLGWGTEMTVIRCGDRNDELCFGTFSTVLLVQHRGLQLWMFYCEQWNGAPNCSHLECADSPKDASSLIRPLLVGFYFSAKTGFFVP